MTDRTTPLTPERMRADIADILLEAPEEIDDNDNLMDLGLDSLRAMTLVTQWSEAANGLEFGAFAAAEPTLAAWWAVVSEHLALTN